MSTARRGDGGGVILATARDWLADDPDPVTRQELSDLLDAIERGSAAAETDVADRFAAHLDFGTAGLRGRLGAGSNRMNLAVVIRCASAIGQWVRNSTDPSAPERGVAICFDARHRSVDFAEVSAEVLAGVGVRALLLPGPLPTPVLAFAVRHLGAAAGIMVTASHNPPADNGYKVYEASGRQIVAPVDREVADLMRGIGRVSAVPRTGPDDPDIVRLGPEVVDAYISGAAGVLADEGARAATVAYTAMHGVGAATFRRAFAAAGFPPAVEVAEQNDPDPDFPTVSFPNPEEPGALDLGLATACRHEVDVLFANDPDADRLGVAVPDPSLGPASSPEGWRPLRGDEIGAILAHHLLTHHGMAPDAVLATTIVSSTLLGRMAAAAGVAYVETLTGFKWISRAPGPGRTLGFGYEEALGYCVGDLVGDKDGITAALVFAEAVADLAAVGRSVLDVLDDLAVAHGVHLTGQWTVRVAGSHAMEKLVQAMAELRSHPPSVVAGRPVTEVVDLAGGDPTRGLAPSDVVTLHFEGARIVVRPSGTEPKLKCYIEVVEPCAVIADLPAARTRAAASLHALMTAIADSVDL